VRRKGERYGWTIALRVIETIYPYQLPVASNPEKMDALLKTVQVLSVVVGVVVSVLSFNATREKEAEARRAEAMGRESVRSVSVSLRKQKSNC